MRKLAKHRPDSLLVKIAPKAGLALREPERNAFANGIKMTVYGTEARARSERYVEIDFEVDRAQIINLAYQLWKYIDAEELKVAEMKARMRREE
jgi:meiotically up-regulated gene 157 (Mug157) protein